MIEQVAVVVPAADEQVRIAGCLDALAAARDHLARANPRPVPVEVVVVLDGCRDDTAAVVAGYDGVRAVPSNARCVGAARAVGTAAALGPGPVRDGVWTAHTDADSQVPEHWLAHMVAAADADADLVLGTVTPGDDLAPPVRAAWQGRYSPGDRHPHVHGANLGIRAATLAALGGWRALPSGEDADLVARAEAAGVPIVRTGGIPVRTSGRTAGRAPAGFAAYLAWLAAGL